MWAIHNILGHPIMEVLRILGMNSLGKWIHDITLPKETPKLKAICTEKSQYENSGINYSWFGRRIIDAVDSGMLDRLVVHCLSSDPEWRMNQDTIPMALCMDDDLSFKVIVNEHQEVCYAIGELDLEEAILVFDVIMGIEDLSPHHLMSLAFKRC